MNDIEYDFMSRNRELKSTASGAFHKRSGARTTFVGLPSDNLTPAQLRKKNGEVLTYNLSKPMTFESFKVLPSDIQREYLTRLVNEYDASSNMLCQMLHVSPVTMKNVMRTLGVATTERRGKMSSEASERWTRFLNPPVEKPAYVEIPDAPIGEPVAPEPVIDTQVPGLEYKGYSLELSGVTDWGDVLRYLQAFPLQRDKSHAIRIEVKVQ